MIKLKCKIFDKSCKLKHKEKSRRKWSKDKNNIVILIKSLFHWGHPDLNEIRTEIMRITSIWTYSTDNLLFQTGKKTL